MKALLLAAALVAAALVYAAFDTDAGLRDQLRESQARNASLRAEIAAREREADALGRGGFAVERAIREELGFVREGETLLRLPRTDHSSARIP